MADKFSLTAQINLQAPTSAETKKAFSKIKKDLKTVSTALNLTVTKKSANEAIKNINKNLKNLAVEVKLKSPTKATINKVLREINTKLKGKNVDVKININTGTATQEVNKLADATKRLATNNKAATQVKKIATETKNLGKESKKAASSAKNMADVFASALKVVLKYDIARRVFSGFTNVIEQGIGDAIKFERELVRIAQVSGQTITQLKGLEKTVFSLAKTLGVSSAALVKTGLILKQTGLSVKDTEIALRALAKTELAPTFDNIADTAETAVAAMRQFSIEASGLESLLSKINTVAANFAIEASDIGVAIKRAGGAFKAAGGSVEELIALMTSVRSTTRETAETIATGFRTIFTRLQRPTTIKFLRQFGIELTDLNGKFVGPFEAVKRLSNALQNLESTDLRFSAIVEQLGGFRQVSKVIPLIQQFGTAQQALNAQLKGSDSLAKDAAVAQQSLAVQMARVTAEVKELFQEMTQTSSFKALAGIALGVARAMTAMAKAITPLIPLLTLLFSFKAAAFIGGTLKSGGIKGLLGLGSSKGGGLPEAFAKGGWVPGSGSGDTVPAMLTPGEFVVRKSAAQAMGSQMEGINKYAKGGAVATKLGSRKATIQNKLVSKASEAFLQGKAINEKDNFVYNFEKQSYDNKDVANLIQKKWKTKGRQQKSLGDLFSKNTLTKGSTFEGLIGRSIGASKNKRPKNSPIDFIKNGNMHEVKFSDTQFPDEEFAAKALLERISAPGSGTFANFKDLKQSPLANIQNKPGINLGNIKAHVKGKGVTKAAIDKILAKKTTRSALGGAAALKLGSRKRVAMGGPISGPDTVPSLLTPGEFVVNKKSAQAIGYDNLGTINKYNKGGVVGIAGAAAGGAQSGLIDAVILNAAITGLTSFATQSGLLSEELGAVVSEFGGTLAQVKGINTALASADIGGAKDRKEFGLFAAGKAKPMRRRAENQSKTTAELENFKNSLKSSNEALKTARLDDQVDVPGGDPFDNEKRQVTAAAKAKVAQDEKAVTQAEIKLKKQNELVAADDKRIKKSKALTLGLELAGAAAIQFGNYLKDSAMKAIEAGEFEGASAQAAAGGGLAAGVQGALAGAAVGGKKGGIYGALILGIGGAALAFYEAEKRIKEVKFAQTLEENKTQLELFQKGTISATSGLISLERGIKKREALSGDVDAATNEKARLAENASAETYATGLGKSVASVDEFDKTIKENSKVLLRTGALRQSLVDKIRDEVAARLDSAQKLREYAEAQREATNEVLRLKGISAVAGELRSNIKTFSDVISGVGTSGIGPLGKTGAAFDNTPRSTQGIKKFEDAVDRIGDSGKSAGLDEFADKVKDGAAVERQLEEVLQRAKIFNPVGKENVKDAILKDILDNIGPNQASAVEGDITAALNKIDITNLDEQEDDIAEAIKGALVTTRQTFIDFAALIDERNAFLKNSYAQLESIENSYIAAIGKARKARVQEEQNFLKNVNVSALGPESNKDTQARFFRRLGELAQPGKGIKGTGVAVNDIGALGQKLSELQKSIAKNNEKLAQTTGKSTNQSELIESGRKLGREFNIIKSILNEYGNSQQRLIVLNEKLARAKQQEETLKGAADKLIFGTADDANQSAKFINSISKALNEGTVMGIAPELRMAVVEVFKSGQFGQEGEDILNRDRANAVGRVGIKDTGVLGRASKDVRDTADEIREIDKAAADALRELARVEGERVKLMANTIEQQNAQFLQDMRVLFHEERQRQAEVEQKSQQRKTDQLGTTRSMLKADGVTDEKTFKALKSEDKLKNVELLRRLQNREITRFNPTDDPTSKGGGYEIQDFLDNYNMVLEPGGDGGFVPDNPNTRRSGTGVPFGPNKITSSGRLDLDSAKMDDKYQPAMQAVADVMKAAGLTSLLTSGKSAGAGFPNTYHTGRTGYSELYGQEFQPTLQKFADANYTNDAADTFKEDLQSLLQVSRDDYTADTVQKISALMKVAQTDTNDKQKKLESDESLVILAKLSDARVKDLASRVAGIASLNALVDEHEAAVISLQAINAKLKMIKGLDPRREEKDAAAKQKDTTLQKIVEGNLKRLPSPIGATKTAPASAQGLQFDVPAILEAEKIKRNQIEHKSINDALTKKRAGEAGEGLIAAPESRDKTPTVERASLGKMFNDAMDFIFGSGEVGRGFGPSAPAPNDRPTSAQGGGAFHDNTSDGINLIKYTIATAESSKRQEGTTLELLAAVKTNQAVATAEGGQESSNQIDTVALDKSFNIFSTAVSDLERVMSGPITMEVGGEIEINVNLTGAEALQESESAFAKIAGSKVTDGINNFITNGLRSSSIAIKGDWTA
jgi:TP901 family phage tail tape measure protein